MGKKIYITEAQLKNLLRQSLIKENTNHGQFELIQDIINKKIDYKVLFNGIENKGEKEIELSLIIEVGTYEVDLIVNFDLYIQSDDNGEIEISPFILESEIYAFTVNKNDISYNDEGQIDERCQELINSENVKNGFIENLVLDILDNTRHNNYAVQIENTIDNIIKKGYAYKKK